VTTLSDLLAEANTSGLSARALARAARDCGHTLNHDTAARYLRGDHGRPDEATLIAFAEILQIPMAKLREAADLPSELTSPYTPPTESSRLTRRQRLAVDEIIRAMLEPGRTACGHVTELDRRRGTSERRAARHGDPEPGGG
jgi:transcriptional regulator with XRE-family HTH domain